jgi:Beta-lactamase
MDIERGTPMRKDGIFRMASMTKPVIGVAVMMMLEEARVTYAFQIPNPNSKIVEVLNQPLA